jgi:hypothetical protein
MINLEGLTFAQKLHALKWAGIKEPKPGQKLKRNEPGWGNNQSPARKALDKAKTDKTFSTGCPYWIIYHDAKMSGKKHRECFDLAEQAWRSIHGQTRHSSLKLAQNQYFKFLKHNNIKP